MVTDDGNKVSGKPRYCRNSLSTVLRKPTYGLGVYLKVKPRKHRLPWHGDRHTSFNECTTNFYINYSSTTEV